MSEYTQPPVDPTAYEADQQPAEQQDNQRRNRIVAIVAAGALVVGAGIGIVSCIDRDGGDKGPGAGDKTEAEIVCEDFTNADAAADASKYNDFAFLPKAEKFSNAQDIKEYVANLFNENGPLANEGDNASMAAAMAAFGAASHDGEAVNPNFSVLGTYADRYSAYSAKGGEEAAAEDCQKVLETLNQDAQYEQLWNAKGAIVTQLVATRNDKFEITEVSLERVVLPNDLGGLVLKRRETSKYGGKGETGYNEVLISSEGNIYFTGLTEGEGGSLSLSDLEPQETDPTNSPVPQGETPFAGGEISDTTIDDNGNITTTGSNANGDTVIEVQRPDGSTEVTIIPVGGGTPTVTTTPGNGGGGNTGPTGPGAGTGNGGGGGGNGGGGGGTGGGGGGTGTTTPPVTQPPVTQPPVTQPPVTQPPVTQPPVTQPPVTEPPKGTIPGSGSTTTTLPGGF